MKQTIVRIQKGKDNLSMINKSIDFLLENAGPVIQYRLRKEILGNLTKVEEENLLHQIYQLPHFKLIESYVKPDGYIGNGMHSWDNWNGQVLHETPLQDGEAAARLLSYYAIPKTHPIVEGYVEALRNEEILKEEFSYIPPEIERFEKRFIGTNSGNSLMANIYTMQAMMGYGDDYEDLKEFQQICLKGYERVLGINSLDEITKFNPNLKKKYNYPYIEADEYFPNVYTLAMLAYTQNWRTDENIKMLSDAINHINKIMKNENEMQIHANGKFSGTAMALIRPFEAFSSDVIGSILYRRILTEIGMLGVGDSVGVIKKSVDNIREAMDENGVLKFDFKAPHSKHRSPKKLEYPTPYVDVKLETDYKRKYAFDCDMTFWGVQLLHLVDSV